MGLEDSLSKLVNIAGEGVPNPSEQELLQDYYKAASVWVMPMRAKSEEDIGRVMAIRPSTLSRKWFKGAAEEQDSQHRGYFVYGKYSGENLRFDVYIPKMKVTAHGYTAKQGPNSYIPTKSINNSLGNLMLALVENGYSPYSLRRYRNREYFKVI